MRKVVYLGAVLLSSLFALGFCLHLRDGFFFFLKHFVFKDFEKNMCNEPVCFCDAYLPHWNLSFQAFLVLYP